jgi:GT2 family glycosyltransferase
MENSPKCGACGGNLYDEDENPAHSFGYGDNIKSLLIRKTPLKLLMRWEYKKIKNYEKNADKSKAQTVNHITGADLMIKKEVIEKIGGFSPDFFLYFEETELEFRIKKAGYELWFVPQSKITHLEGKSSNPMRDKLFIDGFITYYRLCYGPFWGFVAGFLQLGRILKYKIKIHSPISFEKDEKYNY